MVPFPPLTSLVKSLVVTKKVDVRILFLPRKLFLQNVLRLIAVLFITSSIATNLFYGLSSKLPNCLFDFSIVSSDFFEMNFYSYRLKGWGIYDFANIYVLKKFTVLMILKG